MKVDRTKVYLTLMICLGLSRGFIDFTPIAIEVFQQQQDGNRYILAFLTLPTKDCCIAEPQHVPTPTSI
jgi:hypothetical protein